MFIREANIEDATTIQKLAHEIWWPSYSEILSSEQLSYMLDEIYSEEKIISQINTGEQTYLLLIEDDEAVAFAAYSPRIENPDIYKLHKLYCLPAIQGKGYGKLLINTVCENVLKAGKNVLELNVNRYNLSKHFYEKMGFVVAYEEDVPIGPYWMNDFVMRKQL